MPSRRLILLVLAIHAVAIYLFTSGFLLTRTELPNFSTCDDSLQAPCSLQKNGSDCWSPAGVQRAIVLIIDALRFDFVAHVNETEAQPWMNQLPVLQRLAVDPNVNSQIFKYIADPPTTTLQRLKGLTTGGLPTFIDVGNSFGAPAIVEDNLILQLKQNGKKVVAMGDDTWLQLFPDHFYEAYPFPSFNVKDLHTVDNGVIDNLFPTLQRDDWDVLIGHFLGVDHVGHIFGVESPLMGEKLRQYNGIIERVIVELQNESHPGGRHENTMLIVMGDHGQTLNGDHGGGTPVEVETALFAMNIRQKMRTLAADVVPHSCKGSQACYSTLPQIDFASTMSMLLGVPIPFGSVGRVHPEFLSLGSPQTSDWLAYYRNVLCLNSWQVKTYLNKYAGESFGGIPAADLRRLNDIYGQCSSTEDTMQIPCYTNFLTEAASLARSQWTQFGTSRMAFGLIFLVVSIAVQALALRRSNSTCSWKNFFRDSRTVAAGLFLALHAVSMLSNSFILEEGHVASFFLGTMGLLYLRRALQSRAKLIQALIFLVVNRLLSSIGLTEIVKDTHEIRKGDDFSTSLIFSKAFGSMCTYIPMLVFVWLVIRYFQKHSMHRNSITLVALLAVPLTYTVVLVHWVVLDLNDSKLVEIPELILDFSRLQLPRFVYLSTIVCTLTISVLSKRKTGTVRAGLLVDMSVALLGAWGGTILLLLGRKSPLIGLLALAEVWCIKELQTENEGPIPVAAFNWNLVSVLLFFCTNHRCTFDGLRYPAAFIGFDEFSLYRQGTLLVIDTYGISHILMAVGFPLLTIAKEAKFQELAPLNILMGLFSIGFAKSITTTFSTICVALQRRHLMVWGLFAPKYVFDAIGLLFWDVLMLFVTFVYT